MEKLRMFETNERRIFPKNLITSKLIRTIGIAIAITLGGSGCAKDPCENIANGRPGKMPVDGEQACFLEGDLFDKERSQAFRDACSDGGGKARRAWLGYGRAPAFNAHVCLGADSQSAWIPEPDENFEYNGRSLR